jgi:hypothetical protein
MDSRAAEEAELFIEKAAVHLCRRQGGFFKVAACCLFLGAGFFCDAFRA